MPATDNGAGGPGLIGSVLSWLRKGYPEGVPPKDYLPLLALLRRRLTDAEVDGIVTDLTTSGHLPADQGSVRAAVAKVADEEPNEEDVALVASRLAAAGWPLAGSLDGHVVPPAQYSTHLPTTAPATDPATTAPTTSRPTTTPATAGSDRPAFLRSILDWLRQGYPQGVPPQDYIPLLALLRRRLSDDETVWVAKEIVASGQAPVGVADIGVLITKITNELPSDSDVDRVRAHLEELGWPVATATSS